MTERPQSRWEPLARRDTDPDFETNPMQVEMYEKYGIEMHDEVWVNDRYQVVVRYLTPAAVAVQWESAGNEWRGGCDHCDHWVRGPKKENVEALMTKHAEQHRTRENMMHLSIHRHDRRRLRDWRHLQQMKNEIAGEDRWAVEVFPTESKLVDTSNEYHLWVLPEGEPLPWAFQQGVVTNDEQVETFNEAREQGLHKGRQHPWEEGLTTGRNEEVANLSEKDASAFDDVLRRQ